MVNIPGMKHRAADAVSCKLTGPNNPDRFSFLTGIRCADPTLASSSSGLNDELASCATTALHTWEKVKLYTTSDKLVSIIESGFLEFPHDLPTDLHKNFHIRDHLYTPSTV